MILTLSGDVSSVKRHWLKGQDMNGADYDARTALHLGKLFKFEINDLMNNLSGL